MITRTDLGVAAVMATTRLVASFWFREHRGIDPTVTVLRWTSRSDTRERLGRANPDQSEQSDNHCWTQHRSRSGASALFIRTYVHNPERSMLPLVRESSDRPL